MQIKNNIIQIFVCIKIPIVLKWKSLRKQYLNTIKQIENKIIFNKNYL